MNEREAKIQELINLKKLETEALNTKETMSQQLKLIKIRAEIAALLSTADEYVTQYATNLDLEQQKKQEPQHPLYSSPQLQSMIDAYNKRFSFEKGYQPGYAKPMEQDGRVCFQFPTEKDEVAFDLEMAKSINFEVYDNKTNVMIAYAKGGMLYHADGKPFEANDSYYPSPSNTSKVECLVQDYKSPSPKLS
jgi:hypothetical protein